MSARLKDAAVNGFKDPFRLAFSLISAIVAVVAAFSAHQPLDKQTMKGVAARKKAPAGKAGATIKK